MQMGKFLSHVIKKTKNIKKKLDCHEHCISSFRLNVKGSKRTGMERTLKVINHMQFVHTNLLCLSPQTQGCFLQVMVACLGAQAFPSPNAPEVQVPQGPKEKTVQRVILKGYTTVL